MKKISFIINVILLGIVSSVICSCGSTNKLALIPQEPTSKEVEINSVPQGATVYLEGKLLGVTPLRVNIPLKYELPAYYKQSMSEEIAERVSSNITFVKDGYKTQELLYKPNLITIGRDLKNYNGVFSSLVYSYPEGVICELEKQINEEYSEDTTIPLGEADKIVSRDNPGSTELERTIIRWYFDSAPRGARVFWRVISSVPSEVKNTNELYLGTTPFEETRSFNILGLTYQNSRDVQIEVKVTRQGYIEQVKRFNVRQAIDQQEISSFFDLIKETTEK